MKTHKLKFFTNHTYHLIDPSPWPLLASFGVFMLTLGLASWMHNFVWGWALFLNGLFLLLYIVSIWWRDVIREATFEEQHEIKVRRGLRFGMILFIISEIMFFFAFGGSYRHYRHVYQYTVLWSVDSGMVVGRLCRE